MNLAHMLGCRLVNATINSLTFLHSYQVIKLMTKYVLLI